MTSTKTTVNPGDQLTLLSAMTLPTSDLTGDVFPRGFVVTVTAELIERTQDRNGESWLDDLSDEAQLARWQAVKVALGDQSDTVLWWNAPGDSASRGLARTQAGELAREISDPKERHAAIAAADALYGAKATSHVIAVYAPDAEQSYGPGKRS